MFNKLGLIIILMGGLSTSTAAFAGRGLIASTRAIAKLCPAALYKPEQLRFVDGNERATYLRRLSQASRTTAGEGAVLALVIEKTQLAHIRAHPKTTALFQEGDSIYIIGEDVVMYRGGSRGALLASLSPALLGIFYELGLLDETAVNRERLKDLIGPHITFDHDVLTFFSSEGTSHWIPDDLSYIKISKYAPYRSGAIRIEVIIPIRHGLSFRLIAGDAKIFSEAQRLLRLCDFSRTHHTIDLRSLSDGDFSINDKGLFKQIVNELVSFIEGDNSSSAFGLTTSIDADHEEQ